MPKKLLSTILLFMVFIGFLLWGLSMLFHPDPSGPAESVVFALLLLGCSGYALVCILMLPRRKER
jgi:vacuolar-type H+-ATPase subunit I/STV1